MGTIKSSMSAPYRQGFAWSLHSRVIALILAFFSCFPTSLFAAQPDTYETAEQLKKIQSQIKKVQKSLGALEIQKGTLTDQLRNIERRYGEIASTLRSLQKNIVEQQARLENIREESRQQSAEVRRLTVSLRHQIRSAYAMGRQERLKMILNQKDPTQANRMLVYFEYLNRDRLTQIKQVKDSLFRLQSLEDEIMAESDRLTKLIEQQKNERAQLARTRDKRKQVLAKLDSDERDGSARLKQLRTNEINLQRLIASLQKALNAFADYAGTDQAFSAFQGRLAWPVEGKLIGRFGEKRLSGRWDGVLIEGNEGDVVRAVFRGRVAYADWLRGYGLLSIIDHGGGYMTLYAFNQSLYKDVGEIVEAGEIIASVGKSGGRLKPGLYFGIRRSGKAIDPVKWCRDSRNDKAG